MFNMKGESMNTNTLIGEKKHISKQLKRMEDTLSRVLVLESEMRELNKNIPFGST